MQRQTGGGRIPSDWGRDGSAAAEQQGMPRVGDKNRI